MVKCLVTISHFFYGNMFLVCDSLCVIGFLSFSLVASLYRSCAGPVFLLYHWTKRVFLGLAKGDRKCGFCCLFFFFFSPTQWKTLLLCFHRYRLLTTHMSFLYSSWFSLTFSAFWNQTTSIDASTWNYCIMSTI